MMSPEGRSRQNNVLADYGELYQLRLENKTLSDTNENLESELNTSVILKRKPYAGNSKINH